MRRYKVILDSQAMASIDSLVDFIKSVQTARKIHPEAKTLSIMKHRWTVVFHIDGDFVVVDRILPASGMGE